MNKWITFLLSALLTLACSISSASTPAPTRPIPAITAVAVSQPVTNAPKLTYSESVYENLRRICVADRVNVREGAGTNFSTIGYLSDNAQVTLLGGSKRSADGGVWEKVKTPIGVGWINNQYVCADQVK